MRAGNRFRDRRAYTSTLQYATRRALSYLRFTQGREVTVLFLGQVRRGDDPLGSDMSEQGEAP